MNRLIACLRHPLTALVAVAVASGPVLAQAVPPGAGSASDPYRISTFDHLLWVTDPAVANSHFRLVNDIDASPTLADGSRFRPIGVLININAGFSGVFDGAGFAIRNLHISRPAPTSQTEPVGLFRQITPTGRVLNLRLENCLIVGSNRVGILAGANAGLISNCIVSGRVQGHTQVGGLVGLNGYLWTNLTRIAPGLIVDSHSAAEVLARRYAGGAVGENIATVRRTAASGEVRVPTTGTSAGGIAGANNHGVIDQCFSSARVQGGSRTGGLVGSFSGTTNGLVRESLSVGTVEGIPNTSGGLAGTSSAAARTERSYWDRSRSRQETSPVGTGHPTSTLRNALTYEGWDFTNTWVPPGPGHDPRLRRLPDQVALEFIARGPGNVNAVPPDPIAAPGARIAVTATPLDAGSEFVRWVAPGIDDSLAASTTVTADAPQRVIAEFRVVREIRTVAELALIGTDPAWPLDGRYTLGADLDAADALHTPIAPSPAQPFEGILDGAGHSIRNLRIGTDTNHHDAALFAHLGLRGVVRNLRLVDISVAGGHRAAGIAANHHGTIHDCSVTGTVSGRDSVGGIAGVSHGLIRNARVEAAITGRSEAGGIVGDASGGRIESVAFAGQLSTDGRGQNVGGIVGRASGTALDGLESRADLEGTAFVGGNVGALIETTLRNAHASNSVVSARESSGGLLGFAREASVDGGRFQGQVHGGRSVGGIAGSADQATFYGAAVEGSVEGLRDVGGLLGHARRTTLLEGTFSGTNSGSIAVGGWVGASEALELRNAVAKGLVSGRIRVGGGVGELSGSIEDSRFEGVVQAEDTAGGLVGYHRSGLVQRSRSDASVIATLAAGGIAGVNSARIEQTRSSGPTRAELAAGGLVGINRNGTLLASTSSGSVEGEFHGGGAAGENFFGTIDTTHSYARISGDIATGGIAGANTGGTIRRSVGAGVVLGGTRTGGIAGENTEAGLIEDSLSTSAVAGTSDVGGIAGAHVDSQRAPSIRRTLFTGTVEGTGLRVGGIVGSHGTLTAPTASPRPTRVESSYWRLGATTDPEATPAGTSAPAEALRLRSTYAGWDFDQTWTLEDGSRFPRLRWQETRPTLRVHVEGPGSIAVHPTNDSYEPGEPVTLTALPGLGEVRFEGWMGVASPGDRRTTLTVRMDGDVDVRAHFRRVHALSSPAQLAAIGRVEEFGLDDRYWLANDIDASGTREWNDPGTDASVREGFLPIGSENRPFTGVLDGQGRTLRGLSLERPDGEFTGLFAVLGRGSAVENLHLPDTAIRGGANAGAIAGENRGGRIRNVRLQGVVSGNSAVGAIAGLHSARLEQVHVLNSTVESAATATPTGVGGLVGIVTDGAINGSSFSGTVRGSATFFSNGGLAGEASFARIRSSGFAGSILGGSPAGGLCGFAYRSRLEDVWADVSLVVSPPGNTCGGGVGASSGSTLERAAIFGKVHASNLTGGLAGIADESIVRDAFVRAEVGMTNAGQSVGGLLGQASFVPLIHAYAAGPVHGLTFRGGLIGARFASTQAPDAYWNTNLASTPTGIGSPLLNTGALDSSSMRDPARFPGWDFDRVWAIASDRNDGFPYLRGLPHPGSPLAPGVRATAGPDLLAWVDSHARGWPGVDLSTLDATDLATAYLLDAVPSAGLTDSLALRLADVRVSAGELQVGITLSVGGAPFTGVLQGSVAIEGAPTIHGPWIPTPAESQIPEFKDGRSTAVVTAGEARFFRARLVAASVE